MSLKYKTIIFDMDGTLVDSQESILETFKLALDSNQIEPAIPLSREIVGPTLRDTLQRISGISDNEVILRLESSFINAYDNSGYRKSKAYDGIGNLLNSLTERGRRVFIATNKRYAPTLKIVNYLKWDAHFEAINAIDSSPMGRFGSKTATIANLISRYDISISQSVYVGDRIDDYDAAKSNGIDALLVGWGYGKKTELNSSGAKLVATVNELQTVLSQGK